MEEAEALLPEMEAALAELERLREEVRRHHEKLQVLDVLWGEKLSEPENPDRGELRAHQGAIEAAVHGMQRIVTEEIVRRGVRFPEGGLEHGLLDFPTTLDGRWVYLCWRRGEPRVRAWHEVHAGFAGRQPLTEEERLRMGRDDPLPDDSALDF